MIINELNLKKDIVGSISNNIVEYFDSNGVFDQLKGDKQRNINRNHYFICMLLSNIITFIPIIILSILFGPEWLVKGFWLTIYYRLLRWQLGGFHFENPNVCLYFSTAVLTVLTYLSVTITIPDPIAWTILSIILLVTLTIGPQLSRDKIKFKDNEEIDAKHTALAIISIYTGLYHFTHGVEIILAILFLNIMVISSYSKRVIYNEVKCIKK